MRVEASIAVAAPRELVFGLSQDYSKRLDWDPFLKEARLIGEASAPCIGVRSWCVTWFGLGMESEYISFNEPKKVAVKMTAGPIIFNNFAASWNFESSAQNNTNVRFCYSFELRKWMGFLNSVVALILRFEMLRRLSALKLACETVSRQIG